MALVRAIHQRDFDKETGKFTPAVLKRGENNGISVFEHECAEMASGTICQHIRKFYPNVVGEPIIYWFIPSEKLENLSLGYEPSDSGDECHRDIFGWNNKRERREYVSKLKPEYMMTCVNGYARQSRLEDFL